ncbi:MAG: hypothetical protein HY268_31710 [Deltaproteobacteria bacterium]|nr:hypothetical protein [Deltaproteobacteria bacterium]
MSYIDPQVRKAAKDLGFERDTCEHCHGTGHIGRPVRPCICTGGHLYYPQRAENMSSERPFNFGKTDEQVLELWARRPSRKRE